MSVAYMLFTLCVSETETLLKAMNVNFHVRENKIAHHTSDYDMSELILRRGQPFDLTVAFNRPYDESTDQVVLQFATGKCCLHLILTLVDLSDKE